MESERRGSYSAMLLIFGGLPGTGKTAIAAGLAKAIQAVHLRIDSIEQALRNSGMAVSGPEGYEVAYAVAEDNLRLGHVVVADSVNPVAVTRAAWRNVAKRAGTGCIEIEVVCSDRTEHRRRVETRQPDIAGHRLPTWEQVCEREYEPWEAGIVVDTAGQPIEASVAALLARIRGLESAPEAAGGTLKQVGPITPPE